VSWRKAEVKDLLRRESIERRQPDRKQKGAGMMDEEVSPVPASGRTGLQDRGRVSLCFDGVQIPSFQYYVI